MDLNVTAYRIVQQLTTETKDHKRAANAKAGKKGGPARAEKLTADERRAIAIKANRARWKRT